MIFTDKLQPRTKLRNGHRITSSFSTLDFEIAYSPDLTGKVFFSLLFTEGANLQIFNTKELTKLKITKNIKKDSYYVLNQSKRYKIEQNLINQKKLSPLIEIYPCEFSSQTEEILLGGFSDCSLKIITRKGKLMYEVLPFESPISAIACSDQFLYIGTLGGGLYLWSSISKGARIQIDDSKKLQLHLKAITSLKLIKKSPFLLTGSEDCTITLLNTESTRLVRRFFFETQITDVSNIGLMHRFYFLQILLLA